MCGSGLRLTSLRDKRQVRPHSPKCSRWRTGLCLLRGRIASLRAQGARAWLLSGPQHLAGAEGAVPGSGGGRGGGLDPAVRPLHSRWLQCASGCSTSCDLRPPRGLSSEPPSLPASGLVPAPRFRAGPPAPRPRRPHLLGLLLRGSCRHPVSSEQPSPVAGWPALSPRAGPAGPRATLEGTRCLTPSPSGLGSLRSQSAPAGQACGPPTPGGCPQGARPPASLAKMAWLLWGARQGSRGAPFSRGAAPSRVSLCDPPETPSPSVSARGHVWPVSPSVRPPVSALEPALCGWPLRGWGAGAECGPSGHPVWVRAQLQPLCGPRHAASNPYVPQFRVCKVGATRPPRLTGCWGVMKGYIGKAAPGTGGSVRAQRPGALGPRGHIGPHALRHPALSAGRRCPHLVRLALSHLDDPAISDPELPE